MLIHPTPIPERRPVSFRERGILLIINQEHVTHVLRVKAEAEGAVVTQQT